MREDTAELAKYQLSDDSDGRSPSFLARRSSQSLAGRRGSVSTDADVDDVETGPSRLAAEPILETSEPSSPEVELDAPPLESPSLLSKALRMYGQVTSAPGKPRVDRASADSTATDVETSRPLLSSRGPSGSSQTADVGEPSETTPLIRGRSHTDRPVNGSNGFFDVESQKRAVSEPDGRLGPPRDAGLRRGFVHLVQVLTQPKRWDRRAVWQNAVVAPISYLPAVTVGLLLNILDALSYGTQRPFYFRVILLTHTQE